MRPVFISYAQKNRKIAEAVCAAAERRGVSCWIAHRDAPPGRYWAESIVSAIRQSRVMVLLHSEAFDTSEMVRNEIHTAINSRVEIVGFRLGEFAASHETEFLLGRRQWIDATAQPLRQSIERLCDVLDERVAPEQRGSPGATASERGGGSVLRSTWSAAGLGVVLVAGLSWYLQQAPVRQQAAAGPAIQQHTTPKPVQGDPVNVHPVENDRPPPQPSGDDSYKPFMDAAQQAVARQDWNGTVNHLDQAIAAAKAAPRAQPANQPLTAALAEVLRQRGAYTYTALGKPRDAVHYLDEARTLAASLSDLTERKAAIRFWIALDQAAVHRLLKDTTRAVAFADEAEGFARETAPSKGVADGSNGERLILQRARAEWAVADTDNAAAERWFTTAVATGETLLAADPRNDWLLGELYRLRRMRAEFEIARQNFRAGVADYDAASALARKRLEIHPAADDRRSDLIDMLRRSGYYRYCCANESQRGRELLNDALAETKKLANRDVRVISDVYANLAESERTLGNRPERAGELQDEAIRIAERMPGVEGLDQGYNGVAIGAHVTRGANALTDGDRETALRSLQRAKTIAEAILERNPGEAYCLDRLAYVNQQLGRLR